MNCKIPFTKDIDFEKKLHEITSISLEHEINIEEDVLKGNFIVSGEFKSHEVSVNKEPFSYILPFEIEILPDVDKKSIEFMIEDFTYQVLDNSILRVNIDFNVIGSKKEIEEDSNEEIFREVSEEFMDNDVDENTLKIEEVKEEIEDKIKGEEEIKTEEKVEEERDIMIENKEEVVESKKEVEEIKLEGTKGNNDEYATYHIHMVSDGETVETICTMYNSNLNILADYNDLNDITEGDKLIIPEKDE